MSAAGRFGSGSSNAISGAADHMRGSAPRPLSGEQLFHLRECRRRSCHLLKSRVQTAEEKSENTSAGGGFTLASLWLRLISLRFFY